MAVQLLGTNFLRHTSAGPNHNGIYYDLLDTRLAGEVA